MLLTDNACVLLSGQGELAGGDGGGEEQNGGKREREERHPAGAHCLHDVDGYYAWQCCDHTHTPSASGAGVLNL